MTSTNALREFAYSFLRKKHADYDDAHRAILALARPPRKNGWKHYTEVDNATEGQWFLWSAHDYNDDVHIDQAFLDADGRIDGKYGCGLLFWPYCQTAVFDDELAEAVAAYVARYPT